MITPGEQRGPNRFRKLGGVSFIAGGLLFLAKGVLELMTGPPPALGTGILAWIAARGFLLAMTIEVLFVATMCLVPAVAALYESLRKPHRASAAVGCGILAVTIPIYAVLLIVYGRIVYPVYGIHVRSPEVAEFVVAIYYGGLHVVALLSAVATFVLSLAMLRGAYGRNIAYLGFATSALDLVGGYPWAIGPVSWFVCSVFFAAWFVAVGFRLRRLPVAAVSSGTARGHSLPM